MRAVSEPSVFSVGLLGWGVLSGEDDVVAAPVIVGEVRSGKNGYACCPEYLCLTVAGMWGMSSLLLLNGL